MFCGVVFFPLSPVPFPLDPHCLVLRRVVPSCMGGFERTSFLVFTQKNLSDPPLHKSPYVAGNPPPGFLRALPLMSNPSAKYVETVYESTPFKTHEPLEPRRFDSPRFFVSFGGFTTPAVLGKGLRPPFFWMVP